MGKVPLTLACWDYDRTRALQDGRVPVEGVELTYLPLRVEETFWRMLRHQEFDAAELSMGSYLMAREKGSPKLIAIPVFPSRAGASSDEACASVWPVSSSTTWA